MSKSKKFLINSTKLALAGSLLIFLSSCTLQKPSFKDGQIAQKIKEAVKEGLREEPVIRMTDNVLYIYIPVARDVLRIIRAQGNLSEKEPEADSFHTFSSDYKDNIFVVRYTTKKFPPTESFYKNITFNFTPHVQNIQRRVTNILHGITGDIPEKIDFFVIIVADIYGGIEIKQTMYKTDFKRSAVGALPWMEFNKRVLVEVRGDTEIMRDVRGSHIDYKNIELPDFIADILIYNLSQKREFKEEKYTDYIQKVFYRIVTDYDFENYRYLLLEDPMNEKETILFPFDIKKKFEKPN
ncbi:MAG: hypothetical protein GF375_01490 [Candidatus Omnitrophica bacterium]|nr:hypothetical protein [Candidatus Omnitrophota bacterium]MBD3268803.1 hypothetical protein [Candidatus Omnitrophota bacterium]